MWKSALAIFEKYCNHWKLKVNLQKTKGAHFMSFSIKFTNSFSISKNAFIDEYREFSGMVYTHPNKRSLLNT
jgi:hypothetical protein